MADCSPIRILPALEPEPEPVAVRSTPCSMSERIISRLLIMEAQEQDPWLRDDYREAYLTVAYASEGSPIPFIEASYKLFSTHPERVWRKIVALRKAKLGREYSRMFDDSGNLKKQWLDIPDYDPTSELAPRSRSAQSEEPDTKTKWPKAPLRRVMNVEEVRDRGRVLYHLERLECGHLHTEFVGANPGKPRRRCRDCFTEAQPVSWQAKDANVVKTTPLRRPKTSKGNVYQMPSPSRSAKQEPLRILPPETARQNAG